LQEVQRKLQAMKLAITEAHQDFTEK
jgi:hypothetical protein